jgi:hypothetical protein
MGAATALAGAGQNPKSMAAGILYTYPVIADKISVATGCDLAGATAALEEVVKFLVACQLHPEKRLSPSPVVDKAWHEFILHTQAYREFSDTMLGAFIHHIPGRGKPTESSYAETRAVLGAQFGQLDSLFWPDYEPEATCDGNPHCVSQPTKP